MIERKPDGGLAEWIETLEAMGGDDDGEMLCLLLELRRFREDKPALIEQLESAQHEGAVNWEAATSLAEENGELKRQLAAAQRERDEYAEGERQTAVKNTTLTDEIYGLKAELKRRDEQEPVAAESRFIDSDWSPCSVEHVEMVQRNPDEWVGYEARLLYDAPVAVPGKVVKLPETYAMSNDRSELVEKSAVMVALDAAGVKWVEGA